MVETIVKNIDPGEKSWTFLDGSQRSAVILDSAAIGRGTYLPGWKWSEHVGKQTGKESQAHIGYILSGEMMVRDPQGKETKLAAGDAFELGPGHDAWVVGDEACVAFDFEHLKKE